MRLTLVLVSRTVPGFNELIDVVSRTFNAEVTTSFMDFPLTRALRKKRKQYDAAILLRELLGPPGNVVFIVREDLFANDLNFVFGLAMPNACIVSTTRLDPRFYGEKDMEKARKLFKERLIKEVLHELGHALGLPHCENLCVMVISNSIEEVDRKNKEYCASCRKVLYLLEHP